MDFHLICGTFAQNRGARLYYLPRGAPHPSLLFSTTSSSSLLFKRMSALRKLTKKKKKIEKQNWNNTPYPYHQETTIINNLVYILPDIWFLCVYVCACVTKMRHTVMLYCLFYLRFSNFPCHYIFILFNTWSVFKFHNLFSKCPLHFICSNHNSIHNRALHPIMICLNLLI